MKKPLEFISVVDETGRTSSLALNHGGKNDTLRVVGVLSHCSEIKPTTSQDRDKLVNFLNSLKF